MQAFYGKPSEETIEKYIAEAELFLAAGYLRSIRYGFEKEGKVVCELEYTAQSANGINDKPGKIFPAADLSGWTWFSYLTYSDAFIRLTSAQQVSFKKDSPLERPTAPQPELASGVRSVGSKAFSEDSLGLYREMRVL